MTTRPHAHWHDSWTARRNRSRAASVLSKAPSLPQTRILCVVWARSSQDTAAVRGARRCTHASPHARNPTCARTYAHTHTHTAMHQQLIEAHTPCSFDIALTHTHTIKPRKTTQTQTDKGGGSKKKRARRMVQRPSVAKLSIPTDSSPLSGAPAPPASGSPSQLLVTHRLAFRCGPPGHKIANQTVRTNGLCRAPPKGNPHWQTPNPLGGCT